MARTQRTRRQLDLLDRLVDLMAAEGFARFTLDDLALRMRCSKTTLLRAGRQQAGARRRGGQAVLPRPRSTASRSGSRPATTRRARVAAYLSAVADQLQPLSRAFMDDLTGAARGGGRLPAEHRGRGRPDPRAGRRRGPRPVRSGRCTPRSWGRWSPRRCSRSSAASCSSASSSPTARPTPSCSPGHRAPRPLSPLAPMSGGYVARTTPKRLTAGGGGSG